LDAWVYKSRGKLFFIEPGKPGETRIWKASMASSEMNV
jgi:uncharacterized protein YaeQ